MAANGIPVRNSIYIYAPNKIAPVFFTLAFTLSFLLHSYQCHHYKSWKLSGLQPLCALLFAMGYALREWNACNNNYLYFNEDESRDVLLVFILSQVFIYIAPPLLELSNYHILSNLLSHIPWLSPLPPNLIQSLFGSIMLLVETLNAIGVALNSNPSAKPTSQNLGGILAKIALALQLAVLGTFFLLAGFFHYRCHEKGILRRRIEIPLRTLYASMILILVRCVYRFVENLGNSAKGDFIDDYESLRELTPLIRYEYWFWIFQGSVMLLNSFLWNGFHPGGDLGGGEAGWFIGRDGGLVVDEREEIGDERGWMRMGVHILSFGILFGRKRRTFMEIERECAGMEEVVGR